MSDQTELRVEDGKVVSLRYTLKNASGELLDETGDDEPLEYLHGADNIVEGLEEALAGRVVGDKLSVVVPPEKGYGVRDEDGVQNVPRNLFPKEEKLETGMEFWTQDEDGDEMPVWVTNVVGDVVTLDLNHPLAGVTLHFDVEVAGVRDATKEEIEHGHPYGDDCEGDCSCCPGHDGE